MKRDSGDPYGTGWSPSQQQQPSSFFASHKKKLLVAAVVIGGLAFAAGWNPPTHSVHSFTEASEYSARRESGCTNSGPGCHGDDEDLQDFNKYHPELECRDCHEYTGVGCIPCHGPAQHECTGCHDGSMEGASDCVRLTDSYPDGHYRESLHEAIGTDFAQEMRAAEGGTAAAPCSSCHSRDLKTAHTGVPLVEGSEYGPEIGCAECHNDVTSGALEQVLGDWKAHRCEDCHGETSNAPMHAADIATPVEATGESGCGSTGAGCHDVNDLHALHPDAPATCGGAAAEGEPGCHDLELQSHEPTVTACGTGEGTCHPAYVNNRYSHIDDATGHTASAQGSAVLLDVASGVRVTCGSCHAMEITTEHGRPGSSLGSSCLTCHNRNATTVEAVRGSWPERTGSNACSACHGSKHSAVGSVHVATQLTPEGTVSASGCVGSGCHPTADVRVLHAGAGCAIAGCHANRGSITGSGIMTCGGTGAQAGSSCHAGSSLHASAKHTATEYNTSNVATPGSCVKAGCHSTTSVNELHVDTGCAIAGCHTAGGPGSTMGCGGTDPALSCHLRNVSYHTKNPNHHIGVEYNNSNVATPGSCAKDGCHTTTRLSTLHSDVGGCYGTPGCHVAGGPSMIVGCGGTDPSRSCHIRNVSYHTKNPNHHIGVEYGSDDQPTPGTCVTSGCHATTRLSSLHTNAGGCYGTAGCHVAGGPSMVIGCGGSDGALSCHMLADLHVVDEASHDATEYASWGATPPDIPATPGGCTDDGCHATVDVRDLHDPVGCFIAACHGQTPSAPLSCGGIGGYPATACHNGATPDYPDTYHRDSTVMHTGVEIGDDGLPQEGACSCHHNPAPSETYTATDVRRLPDPTPDTPTTTNAHSCHGTAGCHTPGGPIGITCGGVDGASASCHASAASRSPFCAIPARPTFTGFVWRATHGPVAAEPVGPRITAPSRSFEATGEPEATASEDQGPDQPASEE